MQMFLLHDKITNLYIYCISISLPFIAFCVCFAVVVFSCLSWPQKLGIWCDLCLPSSCWWTSLLSAHLSGPVAYSLIQFGPCLFGMAHWVECYWNPFALFTFGDNNHIKVITANALRSLMWFPLWRFNIFPCTIVEHAVAAIWRKHILGFLLLYWRSHLVSSSLYLWPRPDGVRRCCILTAVHFLCRT